MIIQVDSFEAALKLNNALVISEQKNIKSFRPLENGLSFTNENDDSGSYQVFELNESSYGIRIHPENNDAILLNKAEFNKEYKKAFDQCDPFDYEVGDLFIQAFDEDLSYQFIRL
jgi:hypothetical protein